MDPFILGLMLTNTTKNLVADVAESWADHVAMNEEVHWVTN